MKISAKIIIFILVLFGNSLKAQLIHQSISVHFGINVNLHFKMNKHFYRHNFPGVKAYLGFLSSNQFGLKGKIDGSFNIGSSITIYNKTLGNSQNLDFQDNQIDWTTNITIGGLWGEKRPTRHLQTINNVAFHNLQHQSEYAIHFGVNFIMNNHIRHQTNGSISATIDRFSFT